MIHLNLPKNICQALLFLSFALLLGACEREEDPAGLTPIIVQIDKITLQAGDVLEIAGRNFGSSPEALTVNFNGRVAEVLELSDTRLLVTVPAGAGSGQLRVIRNERSSNAYPYAYRFRLGAAPEIVNPSVFNGGELQLGVDGNLYYLAFESEDFTLYRLQGNTFVSTGRLAPGSGFISFFVDAQGNFYYRNSSDQVIKNNDTSTSTTLPLANFSSDGFFVDTQGNIYYSRFDDDGANISTVNINTPTAPTTLFAPVPGTVNDFVLGQNSNVWTLEDGFSGDPSIIYESGRDKIPRQVASFSNPFSGSGRISFAPDINVLCVKSSNSIFFYDTFSAVIYEMNVPPGWGSISGATLGTGGELFVISFDFSEYVIRRVTLE